MNADKIGLIAAGIAFLLFGLKLDNFMEYLKWVFFIAAGFLIAKGLGIV